MRRHEAGAGGLSAVVAANVRAEAARREVTQAELAKVLGMSAMAVSDRYRGRTAWTVDELEVVAARLGVPTTSLMRRPPEPAEHSARVLRRPRGRTVMAHA